MYFKDFYIEIYIFFSKIRWVGSGSRLLNMSYLSGNGLIRVQTHTWFLISATLWNVLLTKLWLSPAGSAANYTLIFLLLHRNFPSVFISGFDVTGKSKFGRRTCADPQRGLAARLIGNGNNWPLDSVSLMGWIGNQSYCLFGNRPSNPRMDASLSDAFRWSWISASEVSICSPGASRHKNIWTESIFLNSNQPFVHEKIKLSDLWLKSWISWRNKAWTCS